MDRIITEDDWLTCDQPQKLSYFLGNQCKSHRFRWLAVARGMRIRHIFEDYDLPWFDAFADWVAGSGARPSTICEMPLYIPLDYPRPCQSWARHCADAIRNDDFLAAAAYAGVSASHHFSLPKDEALDYTKTHRKRSNKLRSAEKSSEAIRHQEWYAAKQVREARIREECCQQIRDVAGNPFQPVSIRPEWLTSTVLGIAQGIDADQAFDRMPILADAIQDAGCENELILSHCRGTILHVRGCWVIDSLLGKM